MSVDTIEAPATIVQVGRRLHTVRTTVGGRRSYVVAAVVQRPGDAPLKLAFGDRVLIQVNPNDLRRARILRRL